VKIKHDITKDEPAPVAFPNNSPNLIEIDKDQMLEFSKNKKLNCPEVILLIMGKNHELSISAHSINGIFHLKAL
jgi:hypothetical protein